MDELLSFSTSSSGYGPPSPASFFSGSAAGDDHHQSVLEFLSIEVPEEWLQAGEDALDKDKQGDEEERKPRGDGRNAPPSAPHAKRRSWRQAREPKPNTASPAINHVEAKRQRREMLNLRFCQLRAAVPKVSRMDRASTLSDATAYITELRSRVQQLEAKAKAKQKAEAEEASLSSQEHLTLCGGGSGLELEVQMLGRDAAALRLTMPAARHAPARLMAALHALDLLVQHASVCRVGGVTVQEVVVDVPAAGLVGEDRLRAALLHRLLQESG